MEDITQSAQAERQQNQAGQHPSKAPPVRQPAPGGPETGLQDGQGQRRQAQTCPEPQACAQRGCSAQTCQKREGKPEQRHEGYFGSR